ncbi:phosphoribosyltransferase domain-containing protein, partial [Kitasatospora sp. NPDC001574]
MAVPQEWTGRWVAERAGVGLTGSERLPELVGLALRENRKRAHLLVSTVLGKHVPQLPAVVHGAGLDLGRRVRELLGDPVRARRGPGLAHARVPEVHVDPPRGQAH